MGLQARWSPPVLKIMEILAEGKVGKVLRIECHASGGSQPEPDVLGVGWEYFADRKVGGNHVTILAGHLIDAIRNTLRSLMKGTTRVKGQVQWPAIKVIDDEKKVVRTITSDVPDLFPVSGNFCGCSLCRKQVADSEYFRHVQPIRSRQRRSLTPVHVSYSLPDAG